MGFEGPVSFFPKFFSGSGGLFPRFFTGFFKDFSEGLRVFWWFSTVSNGFAGSKGRRFSTVGGGALEVGRHLQGR